MDGNGRWGLKHKNSRKAGHNAGLKTIQKIIKESIKNNLRYLTLYTFSTENWKRPKDEIKFLFNLLENFLKKKLDELHKNNIKLKIIGNKKLSIKLNKILEKAEKKTYFNSKLQINLALNYGSKTEILEAVKKINKSKLEINEKNFLRFFQTYKIPDPDLLIRTGNTRRLSNFLLWQIAYSEIYFVKKLWPDFNEKDFKNIILDFKKIKRNFGSI